MQFDYKTYRLLIAFGIALLSPITTTFCAAPPAKKELHILAAIPEAHFNKIFKDLRTHLMKDLEVLQEIKGPKKDQYKIDVISGTSGSESSFQNTHQEYHQGNWIKIENSPHITLKSVETSEEQYLDDLIRSPRRQELMVPHTFKLTGLEIFRGINQPDRAYAVATIESCDRNDFELLASQLDSLLPTVPRDFPYKSHISIATIIPQLQKPLRAGIKHTITEQDIADWNNIFIKSWQKLQKKEKYAQCFLIDSLEIKYWNPGGPQEAADHDIDLNSFSPTLPKAFWDRSIEQQKKSMSQTKRLRQAKIEDERIALDQLQTSLIDIIPGNETKKLLIYFIQELKDTAGDLSPDFQQVRTSAIATLQEVITLPDIIESMAQTIETITDYYLRIEQKNSDLWTTAERAKNYIYKFGNPNFQCLEDIAKNFLKDFSEQTPSTASAATPTPQAVYQPQQKSAQVQPAPATVQPTKAPQGQPFTYRGPYNAAGVLPYAHHQGKTLILLGKVIGNRPTPAWGDFGGQPEKHETPQITAAREFYEETKGTFGKISTAKAPWIQGPSAKRPPYFEFLVQVPYIDAKSFDKRGEIKDFAWVDANDLLNAIQQRQDSYLVKSIDSRILNLHKSFVITLKQDLGTFASIIR